jgi:flagellar FliL protein
MSNNTSTPNQTGTPAVPAAAPKGSRKKLVIMATAALVVLLGGGGAAYWMLSGSPAEAAPAEEEKTGPGAAVPLEPFIVNLADPGARRFLRVSLSLIVEDEEHALEIAESDVVKIRIRSAILELLALQTADSLITPDGKTALKKAIAEGAGHAVEGLHISDVLFSEFVVQF